MEQIITSLCDACCTYDACIIFMYLENTPMFTKPAKHGPPLFHKALTPYYAYVRCIMQLVTGHQRVF